MKILFYTNVYPDEEGSLGGIFIHNQAMALQKAGHNIAVLFIDFRSLRKKRKFAFSEYVLEGIKVYRYAFPCGPVFPLIDAVGTMLTENTYKRVIKIFGKPDIIYAHFGGSAKHVLQTVKVHSVPLVLLEHDSGMLTGQIEKQRLEERKTAYNESAAVIAVSTALKKKMQGLTNKTIEVVPNIIPDYMFEYKDMPNKASLSDFLFISVGNLIKSKSFDLTITAFANVVQKHRNAKLIIVGEGPEEDGLRKLVNELGVKDKVDFKGKISNMDLANLLKICDCFVLTSKFETFGVVYIEAMASGLPVIATRCGGPEEFINPKNGILVPVDDTEAISEAMVRMIKEKDFEFEYLRNFAYNLSSEQIVVQKIERIFKHVIENNYNN